MIAEKQITATDIDRKLRAKFLSHKYELSNTYVYNWECDFFSITSTGYAQEIEIKVSYSDFKADFKKEDKHKVLRSNFRGLKTILRRTYDTFEIEWEEEKTLIVDGRRVYDEENRSYKKVGTGKIIKRTVTTDNIKSYGRYYHNFKYKQLNSGIHIHKPGICPNKFWYCCPEGVIPIDEIPEYAGLYYLDKNMRMKIIKKAPFIHKEKHDLTKVLLEKFYWQCKNQRIT